MSRSGGAKLKDAWDDDDWEAQADRAAKEPPAPPKVVQPAPLSKKERLAQHAELNRKLWESAEGPPADGFQYLPSQSSQIPASMQTQSAFKPALKVLSRRPAPQMIAKKDPATGLSQLTLEDDSDDEDKAKKALTPEEIRARQQRELEEKQRRYEEARAKIFGTANGGNTANGAGGGSGPSSGASTPGTTTPPRSYDNSRGGRGGRGRGRGGFRNQNSEARGGGGYRQRDKEREQPRPGQQPGGTPQELYDPGYAPRPSPRGERGGVTPVSGRSTPRDAREEAPVRAPRGPDGTGRGGFGFARRNADNS
ncbi:uncharacterized protein B0I36DRAFT_309130 [Microdochium trichocladiopsis]|uniref:SUZ domain-containing protein n=1 Tax=Microdochium trichocladiopsis TaxID=1682393 RepID=A0A9P9BVM0_9PEZI|nr:uncharacterized protein B0I36DRAFT_309130 [Microdochium trichocladiopsis]KAH7039705.1 hypothetical protein B0I36DRAFT_309130 [Microdochium trichocladiopsis]